MEGTPTQAGGEEEVNEIDLYILADKTRRLAYDIGDLIGEVPLRKKQNTDSALFVNIKTNIEELVSLIHKLEE